MRKLVWGGVGVLLAVTLGVTANAQDLNTLLTYFIQDMRNGTWGVTVPASKLTLTNSGIAVTPTDSLILTNATAATGGATVQMSPRIKLRGNAWDTSASETVDFLVENLPATAATPTGTLKIGYSLNGAAVSYPLTVTSAGVLTTTSSIISSASVQLGAGNSVRFGGGATGRHLSTADKLHQFDDQAEVTGLELNGGTPTLGTCTGGSMTSGSHNTAGNYTGNTSGSCVINFGTPNFTNTPFCFAMSTASTTHPRISASANNSITVTGGVSGEAIQFFCIGRIGT